MEYSIIPIGGIWCDGAFNIPLALADKYIKLASEYQLKALLILLSTNGKSTSSEIAKKLGITSSDAEDIMEFWQAEGVVLADDKKYEPAVPVARSEESKGAEKEKAVKKIRIAPPVLSPKDIVVAMHENEEINMLLNESQVVLGRTLSHSEQEMLVNMVNFYGLNAEIVLMILQYWKSVNDKNRGRVKGVAYVLKIAQNWLDEGINTIEEAEEKLRQLEKGDRLWNEIAQLCGISHKKPTVKQNEMIVSWSNDFSMEMISCAIERMRENTASPSLAYVNKVLSQWKKKGISTPADAEAELKRFEEGKATSSQAVKGYDKIKGTPSYNLDEIIKNAQNNTDIKF